MFLYVFGVYYIGAFFICFNNIYNNISIYVDQGNHTEFYKVRINFMLIKSSNSILNILFKPIYYEREKYFLLHKSNLKGTCDLLTG